MNRRHVLGFLVAAGSAVVAGIVGIPAAITVLASGARRSPPEMWRALGPLEEFPVQQVRTVALPSHPRGWPQPYRETSVFVWRPDQEEIVVFSRSCTDLACPLNHDAGSGCFFCPCHGGIFDRHGTVMAGPPSRPMQRYAARVRDRQVEVDLTSRPLLD
jgi:menaquinol-cytochrome c reductase iron-sulfur subunit